MTKKHYEAIAAILAVRPDKATTEQRIGHGAAILTITKRLADYFEQDNPKFQRSRFLEACGVEHKCPQCGTEAASATHRWGHCLK